MMRSDPTALLAGLAGLDEPDCLACATGWHAHCRWPDFGQDDAPPVASSTDAAVRDAKHGVPLRRVRQFHTPNDSGASAV